MIYWYKLPKSHTELGGTVMGLFDKKYCDFCGEKIGLLGNKKLEDGNMCKQCASKLSPWFSERRHSTRAEIQAQLDYREENKKAVAAFHPTRSIGKYTKLLIDNEAKKFAVTSATDLEKANPDILDFSQVRDCRLDIDESRSELKDKDTEGKSVSYDPPRYEYSYSFHVEIDVDHPYFDSIRYSISNGYIRTGDRPDPVVLDGWQGSTTDGGNRMKEYYAALRLGNETKAAVDEMRFGPAPTACQTEIPMPLAMAEQMDGQSHDPDPASAPVSSENTASSAVPVVCPWCGLTTVPDQNGCCEFCTGTL